MNALANSQLEELDKFISNVRGEKPITFDRYTGQDDAETRRRISENPPDILLTNFMMLELLMTRQDEVDRRVIGNCVGLRFLVLDELHTYRGRQGADVALLVRRVRERLAPERLQCVGTSATMASEGSLEDKSRVVARVASKLFSIDIPESNVIVETLDRVTDATLDKRLRPALGPAIDAGLRPNVSDAELRGHPLAVWVETRLGVSFSDIDQRWVRARPRTVTEAVAALSEESGRDPSACRTALRDLLLISTVPEVERTAAPHASARSFFAFKLHQFISGAGHAFATLDAPGRRVVTVEGQQFLPGDPDKRLYAAHFCRDCGHEYHPVRLVAEGGGRTFLARDIDDAAPSSPDEDETVEEDPDESADQEVFGFITPHAPDRDFTFADRDEDYPETWLDFDAAGNPRLKPHYRAARARSFAVAPTGKIGSGARAWFVPGKFRFCLRCRGDTGRSDERPQPARVALGGRSKLRDHCSREQRASLDARPRLGAGRHTRGNSSASLTTVRTPPSNQGTSTTSCSSAWFARAFWEHSMWPGQAASGATSWGARSRSLSASIVRRPRFERSGSSSRHCAASTFRRPKARFARCSPIGSGSISAAAGGLRTPTLSSSS